MRGVSHDTTHVLEAYRYCSWQMVANHLLSRVNDKLQSALVLSCSRVPDYDGGVEDGWYHYCLQPLDLPPFEVMMVPGKRKDSTVSPEEVTQGDGGQVRRRSS